MGKAKRGPLRLRAPTKASAASPSASAKAVPASAGARPASRQGTRLLQGHFPEAVAKRFKKLGVTLERTAQDLLTEAVGDLLEKYDE
jgi:hypothetical protein